MAFIGRRICEFELLTALNMLIFTTLSGFLQFFHRLVF
jgi:hypothetical protein